MRRSKSNEEVDPQQHSEPRKKNTPRTEIEEVLGGVVVGPEGGDQPNLVETPFEGTTTGRGGRSNRIDITFDPAKSEAGCPCERVRFIQVMQILIDGTPVDAGDLYGPWEYRDNTALDDDPETEKDETSTHVDRLPGRKEPYYGGNGAGTGASVVGSCNGTTTRATMQDVPNIPNAWFAPGGGDSVSGNDWNANEIVFEFEACAFCEAGERVGQFMECVKWVYRRTAADVAAGNRGTAEVTGTASKPSKAYDRAVKQWIDARNFDLPGAQ